MHATETLRHDRPPCRGRPLPAGPPWSRADAAPNLGAALGVEFRVKRDDCTGLALGGNKVRQLEFYLGEAQARGADTVLVSGAVQSNLVRLTAAGVILVGGSAPSEGSVRIRHNNEFRSVCDDFYSELNRKSGAAGERDEALPFRLGHGCEAPSRIADETPHLPKLKCPMAPKFSVSQPV